MGFSGFLRFCFSGYHQVMFGFPQEKRYASYQNLVGFTSVVIKAFSLKIKSFIPDIPFPFTLPGASASLSQNIRDQQIPAPAFSGGARSFGQVSSNLSSPPQSRHLSNERSPKHNTSTCALESGAACTSSCPRLLRIAARLCLLLRVLKNPRWRILRK
jgi:hypothetical protein